MRGCGYIWQTALVEKAQQLQVAHAIVLEDGKTIESLRLELGRAAARADLAVVREQAAKQLVGDLQLEVATSSPTFLNVDVAILVSITISFFTAPIGNIKFRFVAKVENLRSRLAAAGPAEPLSQREPLHRAPQTDTSPFEVRALRCVV